MPRKFLMRLNLEVFEECQKIVSLVNEYGSGFLRLSGDCSEKEVMLPILGCQPLPESLAGWAHSSRLYRDGWGCRRYVPRLWRHGACLPHSCAKNAHEWGTRDFMAGPPAHLPPENWLTSYPPSV